MVYLIGKWCSLLFLNNISCIFSSKNLALLFYEKSTQKITFIFVSFQFCSSVHTAAMLVATWADHVTSFSVKWPAFYLKDFLEISRLDADKLLSAMKGAGGLKVPEFCTLSVWIWTVSNSWTKAVQYREKCLETSSSLMWDKASSVERKLLEHTHTHWLCSQCNTSIQ